MKLNQKTLITFLSFTLIIILILPVYNLITSPFNLTKPANLSLINRQFLFNFDNIQSKLNYWLYKQGISLKYNDTIVGKDGWLFLGNKYEEVLFYNRTRYQKSLFESQIQPAFIATNQFYQWLKKRNIDLLFIIVPNKHTIYQHQLPDWITVPQPVYTDYWIQLLHSADVPTLDLRHYLRTKSSQYERIYYKLDSHWNYLGSHLAYKRTIKELEMMLKIKLFSPQHEDIQQYPSLGGDLAKFLKINTGFDDVVDFDYNINYTDKNQPICYKNLSSVNQFNTRNCVKMNNYATNIHDGPSVVVNEGADNKLSLLWLIDSFGRASSMMRHSTFYQNWSFHHNYLTEQELKNIVIQVKPDMVVFQVIERQLPGLFRKK
jgi:alginate O-acetyltransferase complex protein AlgJ